MTKQKSVNQVKQDVDQVKDPLKDRSQSPILRKGDRILGQNVSSGFNNKNIDKGKEIGEHFSAEVHKNLDKQDELVKQAKRVKASGYGIRTKDNAKVVYPRTRTETILKARSELNADYTLPDFTRMKPVLPERSGLFEVPYSRYDSETDCFVDDHTFKALYKRSENSNRLYLGKEAIPVGQPVVSHEFMEDVLFDLADKNKTEWEIVPEITYDDKRGYRKYWGVLSKRLDREIKGSFRIGDVVRVGALIRNGIAESTSVGFDFFTYCVMCQNGSVGRGKELGSEAWKHIGPVEILQKTILNGFKNMFDAGEQFVLNYEKANLIDMTDEMIKKIWEVTGISNKYFEEAEDQKHRPYFELIPEKENKKKIDDIKLARPIKLWEGYNALTQQVWHSDDMAFGKKSTELRRLNDQLVAIVKATKH